MNILILNWRDIRNPSGGGAELLTHEVAKRWVSMGHNVTQFSSRFEGSQREEFIDGVRILRYGHPDARWLIFSVHFLAFVQYFLRFRGNIDVVIDEVHGLPFFTPWYVQEKKVVLVCEVARELWIKMFGTTMGKIGMAAEQYYLKHAYKGLPFLTISPSTKKDLYKDGVEKKHITVLPMGLSVPKDAKRRKKTSTPTIIFVGRLAKSKGIEDVLYAFALIKQSVVNARLWIVGRGDDEYTLHIKHIAKSTGHMKDIQFLGYVSESEKYKRMSQAQVLCAPSMKEGWGLIVPEAGIVGTPAVVYDTQGLRDIVDHESSGIIADENTPQALAQAVIQLLHDKRLYNRVQQGAVRKAKTYSWDNTALSALNVMKRI